MIMAESRCYHRDNHPREEDNLIHLLMEGKQRGIAGMVILTGDQYIQTIPPRLIALADEPGTPLIEQPHTLKIGDSHRTHRYRTDAHRLRTAVAVRSSPTAVSRRDAQSAKVTINAQLHQQREVTRPMRGEAVRGEGIPRQHRQLPPRIRP
jgi:Purine catabolism regulatory protein-like family.